MQPVEVIEKLFGFIVTRFGDQFLRRYDGLDLNAVKADWAMQLNGLTRAQLNFGRLNLPQDFPPNAAQFRVICIRCPEETRRLPMERPEPDLDRLEREFRRLGELAAQTKKDPKGWARRLKAMDERGERLTIQQRNAYKRALLYDDGLALTGNYTPIDPKCLPPGGLRPEP